MERPPDDDALLADAETLASEDELREALTELGQTSGVIVRCYKYGQIDRVHEGWLRCVFVPAPQFNADAIAREFGPGKYRFQIIDSEGVIAKTATVAFAAPLATVTLAPQPGSPSTPAAPLDSYRDYLEFTQKMLLTLIGGLVQNRGPQVSVSDLLSAVKLGREGNGSGGGEKTMFDAFKEGLGLAREIGIGGGSENSAGLLERIAPVALEIVRDGIASQRELAAVAPPARPRPVAGVSQPAGPAAALPRPAGNPPPAPKAAGPVPAGPVPAGAAILTQLARKYGPMILTEAEQDHDPEVWGVFMYERCPDPFRPVLKELVEAEPAVRLAMLCEYAPGLEDYSAWVNEASEAIAREFEADRNPEGSIHDGAGEPASDGPESERRSGDRPDGGSHPPDDSRGGAGAAGQTARGAA